MSDIRFETNAEKVSEIFKRFAESLEDMSEAFRAGAEYWKNGYGALPPYKKALSQSVWDTNGRIMQGAAWAPLSPRYAKIRKPGPILVQSGRLRAAVQGKSSEYVENIGKKNLTLGVSGIPYARVHQYGYPPRNTPQRSYILTQRGLVNPRLIKFFEDYYTEELDKIEKEIDSLPKGVL